MLNKIISSKTRIKLLTKFFLNIDNKGYLNGLANEFGESTNSVRKELNNLSSAGYLFKELKDNKVIYQVNQNHPLFKPIQKIIYNNLGISEIIDQVIDNIGDIDKIYLLGDYARGIDSGRIQVLIIGRSINLDYLEDISKKIEKKISRKVNFMVSTEDTKLNGLLIFEA